MCGRSRDSWVPADDLAHFVLEAVSAAFLVILKLARELKLLKVGTISVDGTRVKANASKFHALTYERACELEEQLKLEIAELMEKAESADTTPADDGQHLPEELARRETLHRKVSEAQRKLEARAAARAGKEQVNGEWKLVCLAYNVKRLHTMIRA